MSDSEYVIEKGIPLPRAKGGGVSAGLPFAAMGVGDSFLIAGRPQRSVSAIANNAGKRLGMKFATRIVPGDVRVWRVS